MAKEVVLTGLRSNSEFHLGNYLGAILPMVKLQKKLAGKYQINMFIPDLHSFTTPVDHGALYEQTLQNLKVFAAAGLDLNDPDTYIYRQSYIPAHSELTWILSCFTGYGEMRRMAQFKERITQFKEYIGSEGDEASKRGSAETVYGSTSMGVINYPILMAADILLYEAKWIPVGEDQRQHVEFARDLAIRMNNRLGDLFIVPEDNKKQVEFAERSEPVRIRSLRNPEKKMSKSIEDPAGTIMLSDSPEDAAKKVMAATTDSLGSIRSDWEKQPGIANLLQILDLLSNSDSNDSKVQWEGKTNYGELKSAVAEEVKRFLAGIQSRMHEVDSETMMRKLETSEIAMNEVANTKLKKVQEAVGLRPKNS